ncbi:unnamed protein product [Trichobilharzia szidati]|nr:unnamed protein product [Trichobilharzia szidati]
MMKPADTDIDFVSSDIPSHMMTMAMPTKEEEEPIAPEEAVRADNPPEPEESVVPHPEEEECPFDSNEQEKLLHQVEVQPQQQHQECEENDFDNEAGQSDIDEMETEFVIKYQKHQQQQQQKKFQHQWKKFIHQPVDYEYAGNVMSSAQTMNTYSVDSSTDNDQRLRNDFPSPLCDEKKKANDEQQQQQHTDMLVMMAADESVQKVDSTTHDDSSLLINDQVRKFDENQIDDTYQLEDNATAATTTTTGLHIDTAETVTEYQPMCSPDSEVSDDSIIRRPDHHQQQQLEEQHYNKEEEGEVEHDECDTDYLHDDEQVQQTSVVNSLMSTPNRCISPNQNIVSSTHPNDDDDDGYDGNDQYDVTLVGKQFNNEAQQQAYSSSISLNNNTNVSMMPTTTMTTDDDGDADGDGDVNTTVINCMPSEGDFNGIATTAFESQLHTDLSTASTSTPLHHHPHLHQEQHSDDVDELKELNYSMNITSTTTINNNNYPYTNGFNLNGGGNANGYSNFEQISTNNNNSQDENHHYNYLYNNNNSSMNQSEQPNQLLETMIDDDDDHITTSELLKSAHLSSHSPYTSRQMLNNCDDNDFSGNNNPMATTPKTPPPIRQLEYNNNNNKDYHGDIIDHLMQDPHYANTATPTTTPTTDESIFDPIKQWGQPLGLPAPVPPSTTTNHHMKVSHAPNVSAKRIRSADTGGKTTSATGDSSK